METKMMKKTLCILLAAAMTISLFAALPPTANAATGYMDIGAERVTDISENERGAGWVWSSATNTLTLTSVFTSKNIWIYCDPRDTINLAYSSNITINNSADVVVRCEGNLNITASSGKLTISSGVTGIYAAGNVTINSGTVAISAATGMFAGGNVTIGGSADLTIDSSDAGITAGGNVTINGGKTNINSGGDGISVSGAVAVNGGSGYIKASGASAWAVRAAGNVTIGYNSEVKGWDGADFTVLTATTTITDYGTFASADLLTTALKNIRIIPLANAYITPVTASFDKNGGEDIIIALDGGSYTLQNLRLGLYTLIPGTDYITTNNANSNIYTLTIKASYLRTLGLGTHMIVIYMSGSTNPILSVTITDNASVSPTTVTYEKNSSKDITVTLNRASNNLQSIKNGSYTLVTGTDYTALGTTDSSILTYSIKGSYLNTLAVGDHKITFIMTNGTIPSLTITVTDPSDVGATLTPATATYDKSAEGDISFTLNRGAYILQSLSHGINNLVQDMDYTVTDGENSSLLTITIRRSFLNTLALGAQTISINMSGGKNPTLIVTVTDGPAVDATITPATAGYDKTIGGDIIFTLNRGSYTLQSLSNGANILVAGTDYTSVSNADSNSFTLVLKASYLATLPAGAQPITVNMSGGISPVFTITVSAATSQAKPEVPFPFTDVAVNVWYYNDVKTAWQTGLIDGRSQTAFKPDDNLTYAEAVKLAACMHELYTTGAVTLQNGSPWYQSYADYARENGIISGPYDWNTPATRAGYMAIFANALPLEAMEPINSIQDGAIPDVPTTHPQAAAIYKLYRAGILQGVDSAHNCNPSSNIKRSEVSAILTRMMYPGERINFSM